LSAAADDTSRIAVAVMRCDDGEAGMCFEAAKHLDGRRLRLRRGYTPADLRARGASMLDRKCYRGDAAACLRYSEVLFEQKDDERALDALVRSCKLEDAAGCLKLGSVYRDGRYAKRDPQRAIKYFGFACDGGSARGCVQLADELRVNKESDTLTIQKLYRKACRADDSVGCIRAGEGRRAAGDRVGAYMDFFRACQLKEVESCYIAGTLAGVEKNAERARLLFLYACEGGYAKGCSKLSDALLVEEGGGRNWGKAVAYAEQACKLEGVSPCKRAVQLQLDPPDWRCSGERECEKLCREGIGKSCERYAQYLDNETKAYEIGCAAGSATSCAHAKPETKAETKIATKTPTRASRRRK
jgi:TPR repeat protein